MAVNLRFFLNLNTGTLSKLPTAYVPYTIPLLTAGDTVILQIGVVSDLETGSPGQYARENISGWSCQVAIGVIGATPHTSATLSVTTDSSGLTVFSGTLPMNVAAITGLFTGSETVTRTFEMQITDSTGVQSYKQSVTLQDELIASSLTDPAVPDVALGKAEAANLYVKLGENNAGVGPILVSADGTQKAMLYLDNQGQLQVAPVT